MTFRAVIALAALCVCLVLRAAGFNFEQLEQTAVKRYGAKAGTAIRDWRSKARAVSRAGAIF